LQPSRTTRTSPLAKLNRLVVGSSATKSRRSENIAGGGGMEIALMVPIFLGLGWVIDRLLGTAPIFMIVMVVLGAIGVFCRLRYAYDDKIRELEAERRAQRSGQQVKKVQQP
jgi:F0F1-type ATP synthase assembly protein I